jgi:hypothetical protein
MEVDRRHAPNGWQAVEPYLRGVSYPADKPALKQHAESQQSPKEVTLLLYRPPERQYGSAWEV